MGKLKSWPQKKSMKCMQVVTWLTLVGFYKEVSSTILKPKKVVTGKDVFNTKKLRHDWLQAKKNLTKCEEREKALNLRIDKIERKINDDGKRPVTTRDLPTVGPSAAAAAASEEQPLSRTKLKNQASRCPYRPWIAF